MVFACLVITVVETLYHGYHIAVEGPEAELRNLVAILLHLLHGAEEYFPFVPIEYGIGDIHNQDIHSCIGQHGEVVLDNVFVLTEEISIFRFSPMIRRSCPGFVVPFKPGGGVFVEHLAHVAFVFQSIVKSLGVPGDIEDAHGTWFSVTLQRVLLSRRQCSSQCVGSHPGGGQLGFAAQCHHGSHEYAS